jgi:quinone-modifying oxidoreductase, subunit QmoC
MQTIKQTIKYEAERVPDFAREIASIPGCENLADCFQCGTCSAACPASTWMDYTPRRVINLTRAGFKDEALKCQTIWLCASCYACTVECPKEIQITNVMYALKQRAIKEKVYPKNLPIPVLAQEFSKMVYGSGRVTESLLVIRLFLKTNPLEMFKMAKLGIQLMRTGRMKLLPEKIKRTAELRRILDAAEAQKGMAAR